MDKLFIIKIGGNIIDNEEKISFFLQQFALIKEKKILIHGGGKLATKMAEEMKIPQQLVEGRRITDAETLKIITMVYAGYINKTIVASLQSHNCNSIGFCGADGNLIQAHKRMNASIDYGYVGDIDEINSSLIQQVLENGYSLVIAPVTHDKNVQLLIINTPIHTIQQQAVNLLKNLISTPSISREEEFTATIIQHFFEENNIPVQRHLNNVWVRNKYYNEKKATLLLNSHHDTVRPNKGYTRDPYLASVEEGKLFGLGSNDAGGALVALIAAFLHFYDEQDLQYNLVLAATAEEEI